MAQQSKILLVIVFIDSIWKGGCAHANPCLGAWEIIIVKFKTKNMQLFILTLHKKIAWSSNKVELIKQIKTTYDYRRHIISHTILNMNNNTSDDDDKNSDQYVFNTEL